MDQHILIVDDDEMFRRILAHHLRSAGYTVLEATSGHEALEIISSRPSPIVITDRDMPNMGGLELCRALRGCEAFGVLYIMMITATDNEDSLVEAIDAGADDFITKPLRPRVMLARVRAGERVVELHNELHIKTREIFRSNAEIEVAYRKAEEANRKLTVLSQTDALTGVHNRRAAMDDLDVQWSHGNRTNDPIACIAIDIDHFKAINDSHGHAVGDQVLVAVANSLQRISRGTDNVYRIGGEEFLIVCQHATASEAMRAAERHRAALESLEISTDVGPIGVTASFGVAERLPHFTSPDDLLRVADEALYAAKHSGRNRVMRAEPPSTIEAA